MTTNEISRIIHNLSVDLELSGRIKESEACRLAAGLLLQLSPGDWSLVTVRPDVSTGVTLTEWETGRG